MTSKAVLVQRQSTRPTWAEVSLSNLRANFRTIQEHVGKAVTVCGVVKADAYGHGAVECALALQDEGTKWLGVTSLDEATSMRDAGITSRILLMTGFCSGEEDDVIRFALTPTVWDPVQIQLLERAAARLALPANQLSQPIHLKIDTGMGRLGVALEELPQICSVLKSSPHLALEGVSTHLASAEVVDSEAIQNQLQRFEEAQQILLREGLKAPILHIANSSAIISRPESWKQMVRPGLALYGYHLPFEKESGEASNQFATFSLKPVLTWKTRILALKEVKAGHALGYGGTFTAKAKSKIAVLPVGYADGLNRRLSNRGQVIVKGQYAPIVGRISMDLTLINVTGIAGIEAGNEVILMGSHGGLSVDAQQHAILADTIPYEILCNISKRVPRKYSK
ncbi:MAG: alanine racemase [Terriglobales bacterium]